MDRTCRHRILALGKRAALTLADTYETEQMGVLSGSSLEHIHAERMILMRNLAQAANLGSQLDGTMIERGIASLQYLIDPENN